MKHLLLVTLLTLACYGVSAQENTKSNDKTDAKDVPEAVRDAFDSKYDGAMMVNWKAKDGKYKASFTQNMKKKMAEFNSTGQLVSEAEKIEKEDLPTPVADAVKTNYSSSNIEEVYRVQKGDQVLFKVKLDNPKKKVMYDAQGKPLKEK